MFTDPFRRRISIFCFVFQNTDPRALARAPSQANLVHFNTPATCWLVSVVSHMFFSASGFQWKLVCDSAWKVHIAKFSLLVGSIFGYLVMGVMADW